MSSRCRDMFRKICLVGINLLLFVSLVCAERIELKSGFQIDGTIIEQTPQYIRIDAGVGVPVTYYYEEIATIDGEKVSVPGWQAGQEIPGGEEPVSGEIFEMVTDGSEDSGGSVGDPDEIPVIKTEWEKGKDLKKPPVP